MNLTRCPVCGGSEYRVFSRSSRRSRNRVVICSSCDMYYANPRPDSREAAERAARRDDYGAPIFPFVEMELYDRAELFLAHAERRTDPGRMLDVGCSTGEKLAVARDRGWKVTGIEPSHNSARVARKRGFEVLTDPIAECHFEPQCFDLVTLDHSLEHIPDPAATIAEARRVLAPTGVLVVAVPNVFSLGSLLFGRHWGFDFHDDHYLHFGCDTLRRLILQSGFEIDHLKTRQFWLWADLPRHTWAYHQVLNLFLVNALQWGIEILCVSRPAARA